MKNIIYLILLTFTIGCQDKNKEAISAIKISKSLDLMMIEKKLLLMKHYFQLFQYSLIH